jgi:hypothetical protein
VEMNPLNAEPLGIEPNQKVLVASRRAEVVAISFPHQYGPSRTAVYPNALFGRQ